jgi:hypothetical protein
MLRQGGGSGGSGVSAASEGEANERPTPRLTTVIHLAPGTAPFESRRVACKRRMSPSELLYFLRHGVQPLRSQQREEVPVPGVEEAAAATEGERHLYSLVEVREAALCAVADSLPYPQDDTAEMFEATESILLDTEALEAHRVKLLHGLSSLRVASAAVCEGVRHWRASLRARHGYYANVPEEELTFFYRGRDYM